jgi:hypothetical protein
MTRRHDGASRHVDQRRGETSTGIVTFARGEREQGGAARGFLALPPHRGLDLVVSLG